MSSGKADNTNRNQTDKKKLGIIIIGILLAVVIALLVAVVVLLLRKEPEAENDGVYVMNEENYDQIAEQMESAVEEGYFETYMNMDWTFPDGASESTDAVLGNSPNNTKPIRCEVVLSDTGEQVFATDVIPVGAQLPPFKLDVDLDAGEYDAVCRIYLLQEKEDGTYTDYSNAGFNITITVEN